MDLAPGMSLAQYRLAEKIDEGDTGVAWREREIGSALPRVTVVENWFGELAGAK